MPLQSLKKTAKNTQVRDRKRSGDERMDGLEWYNTPPLFVWRGIKSQTQNSQCITLVMVAQTICLLWILYDFYFLIESRWV